MITIFTLGKKAMKKLLKFYILSFVLFFDFHAFAQPGAGDGGGGLEGGDPLPASINSKLILLAIAGVCFVIYTFLKTKVQLKRNGNSILPQTKNPSL